MEYFHQPELGLILIKLSVSFFCGLMIGIEREFRGKDAGLKTYMLISMGACLFTIVSSHMAYEAFQNGIKSADPTRIAAQVVTGIGFLGAGAIIRQKGGGITGLTTAAGSWGAAAIGLAAGSGMLLVALISAVGYILSLELFIFLNNKFMRNRFSNFELVVVLKKQTKISAVRKLIRSLDIEMGQESVSDILNETHYNVQINIQEKDEDKISEKLENITGVIEVRTLKTFFHG